MLGNKWNPLKEEIAILRSRFCDRYCLRCEENCCSGRLNPAIGKSGHFSSLPVVRYKWHKTPAAGAYLLDRRGILGGELHLCGRCPYLQENLCSIHESPDRPQDCVKYPLSLVHPFQISLFLPVLLAERSCPIFLRGANCMEAQKLADRFGVEFVLK